LVSDQRREILFELAQVERNIVFIELGGVVEVHALGDLC
jgi:hypothetical protein